MGVDLARVAAVHAAGPSGSRAGSGYLVAPGRVLTAAHVLTEAGLGIGDAAEVSPSGSGRWLPARIVWVDPPGGLDAALIGLDDVDDWPSPLTVVRWGRIAESEPVSAAAVGYPWAQELPDTSRDTEHVIGFVPPGTGRHTGRHHLTIQTSTPASRDGGRSPWSGMSGAALVAGHHLVGVVVVDPARYGADRLVAVPAHRILVAAGFTDALGETPHAVDVGATWRLQYGPGHDQSLSVVSPYRRMLDVLSTLRAAPSRLLHPSYGVVPFTGRGELVDLIAAWCLDSAARPGLAVHTVTGGGGSGKSRLAAEVCLTVTAGGWDAGVADFDAPGGAVQSDLDRPTLIVIDDADVHASQIAGMIRVVSYGGVPVRLLLLARSRTPWWESLDTLTENTLYGYDDGDLRLGQHPLDPDERLDHYKHALTAFRAALGDVSAPSDSPAGSASAELSGDAFADPLLLHLAALQAAADDPIVVTAGEATTSTRERVLSAYLRRESLRRQRLAAAETPPLSEPVEILRRSVALACLANPQGETIAATEAEAAALLRFVPDLSSDSDNGRRFRLARWLHDLHPGPDYWNPLRPDPLADQLLAELPILPHLANNLLQLGEDPTLDRFFTELIRAAAATGGAADQALADTILVQLDKALDAAVAHPEGPIPQRLFAALRRTPAPMAAAVLQDRLPEQSLALADLAAEITSQAVTYFREMVKARPDAFWPDLAKALSNQSHRLADLGRREEALTAIDEAVKYYRQLAEAQPDAFRPGLAWALSIQSGRLADLDRPEEALTAIDEAFTYYRQLAEVQPDVFRQELVRALSNQSNRLAVLGRREEALTAIDEAVRQYRELAEARPDTFRPYLARALGNQSLCLVELDRLEEALAAIDEAVMYFRELAEGRPDAFRPGLAWALTIQSQWLAELGRRKRALTAIDEAVRNLRALAGVRPDAFLADLARALGNQSLYLAELGRRKAAQTAIDEAVKIWQELAIHQATHKDSLAEALQIQAAIFQ